MAFEFLRATWPEVFLAETHALLAGLGVRVQPPDADRAPPLNDVDADHRRGKDDGERGRGDEGEEGGHA